MRVLVACEISGVVRDAFLAKGHDAWSCDLLHSDHPRHITGDVLPLLTDKWDLLIAHPPCTDLAVSGASRFKEKLAKDPFCQINALKFVENLMLASIPKIGVENPVSIN